jgi:leucyl/phenylalanyl-tRNA--protein transferase
MHLLRPGTDPESFPPVEQSTSEGLVAVGGDLSPLRLLAAYRRGIFPWFSAGQPILWWSPDPRAVLYPGRFHSSRSLDKSKRNRGYEIRYDTAFELVVGACAAPRAGHAGGAGTWITAAMKAAYVRLHRLGHAHSVETWHDGRLVGGLYGIAMGGAFFGESMFSRATDASKVALATLVARLRARDCDFIDCQLPSRHILSLGAVAVPRARFLEELAATLRRPALWA